MHRGLMMCGAVSAVGRLSDDLARAGETQDVVSTVLDERRARIAEKFLHRVFLAESVATEDLQGVAGDLEGCLGAESLGRDRMLQRWSRRSLVVNHHRTRECPARLDLGEHFEQMLLHQLVLTDRFAALHSIARVIERISYAV